MSEIQVDTISGSGGTTVTIKTGHTLTLVADMDAGTAKITNMGDPTSAQDAATKAYVDTQLLTLDTIGELTDVTITSVTDNELLAYDSTSSEWINQTASEAGLATSGELTTHSSDASNPHSVTASQVGIDSTDDVSEGSTNVYWTQTRFDNALGLKTTDDLTEGSLNLYYDNATVLANRLDQFAVPTADIDINSNKITNVTDPTSAQDVATKNYVDTAGFADIGLVIALG